MLEAKLLACFIADRDAYETYEKQVTSGLSPYGKEMLVQIGEYYASDVEATHVDFDLMADRLQRTFGKVPKHRNALVDLLTEIASTDTSVVNVKRELQDARKEAVGAKLAEAILLRDTDSIDELLSDYVLLQEEGELDDSDVEVVQNINLSQLEETFGQEHRIKLSPPSLNAKLNGGLVRGHHLLVAALPEVGKTMVAVNLLAGFVYQGLRVLYIGNEDPLRSIAMRLLSNLTGVPSHELFKGDEDALMEAARSRGYGNACFVGMAPGSIGAIDALMRDGNYDVLIIDQLRNLDANSANNTERLEAVSRGARLLGRKHDALVVSITQASDAARDRLVLHSGMIDGSRIGMPATVDVMLMVGTDEEYTARNLRKFTLVKNKVGMDREPFTVAVDPSRSRIMSFEEGGLINHAA